MPEGPPDRMTALFALRADRPLTAAERRELDTLVAEYGRAEYERNPRRYAACHHLDIEAARAIVAADLDRALDCWRTFQADPENQHTLIARARQRRATGDR